jgi:hypothetical protein
MNLLVTGPAYWPTEEITQKKFWLYLASCRKYGITPQLYGPKTDRYEGGANMRIYGLVEFLKTVEAEYTHVLFSHVWDVLFTAPIEEIIFKYEGFGRPSLLMGAASQDVSDLHPPESDRYLPLWDKTQPYWYPAWSMYLAEIPYIVDRFGRIERGHYNDCIPILDALESNLLEPVYDSRCDIFQTLLSDESEIHVADGTVHNTLTNTSPTLLHFIYACADQETGKDAVIVPWARQLGII